MENIQDLLLRFPFTFVDNSVQDNDNNNIENRKRASENKENEKQLARLFNNES